MTSIHVKEYNGKPAEINTDLLANKLSEELCILCYVNNEESDLNRELIDNNCAKQFIKNHNPRYAVDLHGCKNEHNFDLDIGTLGNTEDACRLQRVFIKNNIDARNNEKFKGLAEETIVKYCYRNNIIGFQIEIAPRLRMPSIDKGLYSALREILIMLNKE